MGGGYLLQDVRWAVFLDKSPSLVPEEHRKMAVHIGEINKLQTKELSLDRVMVSYCP